MENILLQSCEYNVNNEFTLEELENICYSLAKDIPFYPVDHLEICGSEAFIDRLNSLITPDSGWSRYGIYNQNTCEHKSGYKLPNALQLHIKGISLSNIITIDIIRKNIRNLILTNNIKDLLNKGNITETDFTKLKQFIDENIN